MRVEFTRRSARQQSHMAFDSADRQHPHIGRRIQERGGQLHGRPNTLRFA